MPDADQMSAVIDAYAACFSAADKDGWLALWADDATMEDPIGTPLKKGRGEIGEFWDQSQGMADSIKIIPGDLRVIAGDEVAWSGEIRPTMGGTEFVMQVIELWRFTDGPDGAPLIAEMRAFWDPAAMRPA
jgi:steroid delta-isomerase